MVVDLEAGGGHFMDRLRAVIHVKGPVALSAKKMMMMRSLGTFKTEATPGEFNFREPSLLG